MEGSLEKVIGEGVPGYGPPENYFSPPEELTVPDDIKVDSSVLSPDDFYEEALKKVDEVGPSLIKTYEKKGDEREVKVLEGKEGVKQLFNDELRVGETIHLIGSPRRSEEMLKYFLPGYTRRRVEQEIEIKGVFEEGMREEVDKWDLIEDRYLPGDHESKVNISIYGDNVGVVFWVNNPLVIIIRDSAAAESFMDYFRMVWDSAEE